MLHTGMGFVLVGNSTPALEEDARAAGRGPGEHFRAARGHAAGVAEGLRHFRALVDRQGGVRQLEQEQQEQQEQQEKPQQREGEDGRGERHAAGLAGLQLQS